MWTADVEMGREGRLSSYQMWGSGSRKQWCLIQLSVFLRRKHECMFSDVS